MPALLKRWQIVSVSLGSARASRAGCGALAATTFSPLTARSKAIQVRDGGAPSPAREARALPRLLRTTLYIKSLFLLVFVHDFELGVDYVALVLAWSFFL